MNYSFKKDERIFKRDDIESLFKNGKSDFVFPFKLFVLEYKKTNVEKNKILISIPKKKYKTAVKRNHIKRKVREAYRFKKNLLENPNKYFHIAFIYIGDEKPEFSLIEKKMIKCLKKINA